MTTVLVTGAAGFLGRTLVHELVDSGYDVRALVRQPPSLAFPPAVHMVIGDMRDSRCAQRATIGCVTVIHLAGLAHALDDAQVRDQDYHSVNVDGTKCLVDGAVTSGVQRFIFASSVKVFGETTVGCVDEEAAPAPQSPYARSKWKSEQLLLSYAKEGRLGTLSLRLPLVYGPTAKGNLYRMIVAIDRGRFPPLPRVHTVRSMLHVRNFVSAVRSLMQSTRFQRPMYVVTDARPYGVTEIYDLLRTGLGLPPPRVRVPTWVFALGARCGDLLQAVSSKKVRFSSAIFEKLMGQACYSGKALREEIGYRPCHTFEAAIPDLIQHYRRQQP